MDLGASPIYAFFKVVFPDILPGVLSGFLLAFTMSLDDFIITHFTRGAGINTLSTLIYSEVRRGIKPSMYALSTVIFVAVLALLLITNFAPKKKQETEYYHNHEREEMTMKKRVFAISMAGRYCRFALCRCGASVNPGPAARILLLPAVRWRRAVRLQLGRVH